MFPDHSIQASSPRILVTGGSGLVGQELIMQLLGQGAHVRAIYHTTPLSVSHPHLENVPCDILDVCALEEAMQGITHVYHCAAMVSYDPRDRKHLFKVNIEGTANIVNACIEEGVQKLVHVSSVAALGRMQNGGMITEAMNWSEETGSSAYGKSKYLSELEVWRGIGEGLRAVIVNPSLILGASDWDKGSSAIFKNVYNELKWYTGGAGGFVDVRDVTRAMILLMNSEITGERFILSAENLSFREVFTAIAHCFHKNPPFKKATRPMAEIIWRLEAVRSELSGKKSLITKETARTALGKVYFDHSKILNAFPSFQFTPVQDTISYSCRRLKEKYNL